MDSYFLASSKLGIKLEYSDLYLIGMCSIMLASKVDDSHHIPLEYVRVKLSHNKFSKEQILEQESLILQRLNFKLMHKTSN